MGSEVVEQPDRGSAAEQLIQPVVGRGVAGEAAGLPQLRGAADTAPEQGPPSGVEHRTRFTVVRREAPLAGVQLELPGAVVLRDERVDEPERDAAAEPSRPAALRDRG